MIDFHSHILPGIDDGSVDLETSLQMLRNEINSGIKTVVLTSHCHPVRQEKIDSFLQKRADAYDSLTNAIHGLSEEFPKLVCASEIRIYKGFSRLAHIDKLAICGTDYILLELPYERWTEDTLEEVYQISQLGLKPVMAHLDRFLDQSSFFAELLNLGAIFQVNSSAFLEKSMRKTMLTFFESGLIHILGSDTHNLTTRPPNLAEAYGVISDKFGEEYAGLLKENGELILKNKPPVAKKPPKLGFAKKLFL